jgi:hypothetical protein
MLWLQYQLIKKISKEDPRIDGSDLPPALINLNDTCGSFAFDYQSIYSPYGLNPDQTGVIGLNNFDDSWGIWGHNLRKVLGKEAEKVYATIHGCPYVSLLGKSLFIRTTVFSKGEDDGRAFQGFDYH